MGISFAIPIWGHLMVPKILYMFDLMLWCLIWFEEIKVRLKKKQSLSYMNRKFIFMFSKFFFIKFSFLKTFISLVYPQSLLLVLIVWKNKKIPLTHISTKNFQFFDNDNDNDVEHDVKNEPGILYFSLICGCSC